MKVSFSKSRVVFVFLLCSLDLKIRASLHVSIFFFRVLSCNPASTICWLPSLKGWDEMKAMLDVTG